MRFSALGSLGCAWRGYGLRLVAARVLDDAATARRTKLTKACFGSDRPLLLSPEQGGLGPHPTRYELHRKNIRQKF